jgi:hypothetical protein
MPPIIIIGMHRSGTSMVTHLLERLGLFVGKRKDSSNEAVFFQKLNKWLLHQSGGSWQHPESVHELLENRRYRARVENYIQFLIKTPQTISFLGIIGYLRYRNIFNFAQPWGWKDPRNTFTLPIWLDIFPRAKVVNVYRHGVDVARSLQIRSKKICSVAADRFSRRKLIHCLIAKRSGFAHSIRCLNLEGGFTLWEQYMTEGKKHTQSLGGRALEIRYEALLGNPKESLSILARFCRLNVSELTLARVSEIVDRSRAYAYRNEAGLLAFARKMEEKLASYGY